MRALLLLFLPAVAVFAEDRTPPPLPASLSIPAQLSKTIDTNRCKAGEVVEMRTLDPVLIGNGVVMPENAKLHARIVGAASRHDDKPSWLLLLVERAEWKEHTVALHAFIVSQIAVRQLPRTYDAGLPEVTSSPVESSRRRQAMLNSQANSGALVMRRRVQDVTATTREADPQYYEHLEDVHVVRDKAGAVFLLSQKSHLKIPSGTMLMLQNQPVPAAEAPPAPGIASQQAEASPANAIDPR